MPCVRPRRRREMAVSRLWFARHSASEMAVCQAPGQRDGRLPGIRPAQRPARAHVLQLRTGRQRACCLKLRESESVGINEELNWKLNGETLPFRVMHFSVISPDIHWTLPVSREPPLEPFSTHFLRPRIQTVRINENCSNSTCFSQSIPNLPSFAHTPKFQ